MKYSLALAARWGAPPQPRAPHAFPGCFFPPVAPEVREGATPLRFPLLAPVTGTLTPLSVGNTSSSTSHGSWGSWVFMPSSETPRLSSAGSTRGCSENAKASTGMKVTMKISQTRKPDEACTLDVEECVRILCQLEISGTATKTCSAVDGDNQCWQAEDGVALDLYGVSKNDVCERLWPVLRDRFDLECAHVHELGHGFNGCIYDWMRPSVCPAVARRKSKSSDAVESVQGPEPVASPSGVIPALLGIF